MSVYYLDTSGVVKWYVTETGSAWIKALTDPASGSECWCATPTAVEVLAAFYLRMRTGTLSLAQAQQAERAFRREMQSLFQRFRTTGAIVHRAMDLVPLQPLRAHDALQLAAALHLQTGRRPRASLCPSSAVRTNG
jgi:uncharacterized protein